LHEACSGKYLDADAVEHLVKCDRTQMGAHVIKCKPRKRGRRTRQDEEIEDDLQPSKVLLTES